MDNSSIDNYKQRILRITRYTLVIISLFLIGILTPYASVFLGLALGTAVSLLNVIYMAWKVNEIGKLAVNALNNTSRRKPMFSGMATRFATSILAIMLVYQYPDHIQLFSTIIGLFIAQIVMVVDGIINT